MNEQQTNHKEIKLVNNLFVEKRVKIWQMSNLNLCNDVKI